MKKKRAILWFRNDLRLHDNEALIDAIKHAEEVIPVYIFDSRVFLANTKFGFPKTGKYRAKFLIDSIIDLRKNLQKIGSRLVVRIGITEDIIAEMAREHRCSWVFCNRERTQEEISVQDALEKKLWEIGLEVRYSRGKMLYYTADLPFPISHCPDVFNTFRKEVEKITPVRAPLELPSDPLSLCTYDIDEGAIPELQDLGHDAFVNNKGLQLKGGESEALKEIEYYIWEKKLINSYKESRNQMLGRDFSSKMSLYLSTGCLSPKYFYAEIKKYEKEHGANDSSYWLFFELMWRDFFRLMGKKHQNRIFQLQGIKQAKAKSEKIDMTLFNAWAEGKTGIPFVDANMRELNATGFMSNRGRQNVASYLINNLKLNWLLGAEYFESLLIDYDPCSNYGNWNYLAGVGNDPREDRVFNIPFQTRKYDPDGSFIKYWIPELSEVPSKNLGDLSAMSESELADCNVILGKDYPFPIINTLISVS